MMKKIQTKYCGEVLYNEKDLTHFPNGLFGFEEAHDFLLIRLEDDDASPYCLQSAEDPSLAFIMVDPFQLVPDYAPDLSDEDCARLGDPSGEHIILYAICVLHESMSDSTVNLRYPIAMHMETHTAFQVILNNSEYSFRHKLSDFLPSEEDTSC